MLHYFPFLFVLFSPLILCGDCFLNPQFQKASLLFFFYVFSPFILCVYHFLNPQFLYASLFFFFMFSLRLFCAGIVFSILNPKMLHYISFLCFLSVHSVRGSFSQSSIPKSFATFLFMFSLHSNGAGLVCSSPLTSRFSYFAFSFVFFYPLNPIQGGPAQQIRQSKEARSIRS